MANLQVGIVGLGKFGRAFGAALRGLGVSVLGVDIGQDQIRAAQESMDYVFQADARDLKALQQLGFADMTHALVSVGSSIEASVLIVLHLKELGIPNLWAKAISDDHERLLKRIGVDHVVFPERYAATELANRLVTPGLIDQLPIGDGEDVAVLELTVDKWKEKTLRDLDLTNHYQVMVVARRPFGDDHFHFAPGADIPLRVGDKLIVIGSRKVVVKLEA